MTFETAVLVMFQEGTNHLQVLDHWEERWADIIASVLNGFFEFGYRTRKIETEGIKND
jgi:hypothetical protein